MRKPVLISHKGISIFFMDFEGLQTASEFKEVIDESIKYIRSQPANSVVALTNMQGMRFNMDIRDLISDFIGGNKRYMKSSAAYGVSGLLRIVYNGVTKFTGREVKAFETKEMALEWLTSKQTIAV